MTADQRKSTYQAKTDHDLLAEMTALTAADIAVDSKAAEALAEMERQSQAGAALTKRNGVADAAALTEFEALSTPAHSTAAHSGAAQADPLAEMTALTRISGDVGSTAADALAEMEQLSQKGATVATRNSAADAAALAEFETLSTPVPKKTPSPAGGDAAYPEPRYSVQVERALYQSQIDLVNAFRPSPRKRRRDYGYDR